MLDVCICLHTNNKFSAQFFEKLDLHDDGLPWGFLREQSFPTFQE